MNKLFLTCALLGSTCALAEGGPPVPGDPVTHKMFCGVPTTDDGHAFSGVKYELDCVTTVVAPEDSLQSCELISRAPGQASTPQKIPLQIKRQSVANAKLEAAAIQVRLHKEDMTAILIFANGAEAECAR